MRRHSPRRSLDAFDVAFVFITLVLPSGTVCAECDWNMDGRCNVVDLNSRDGLYSAGDLEVGVRVHEEIARFDLTADGLVNSADVDRWLLEAARQNGFAEAYLKGDTNLNDHVGFGDFTQFSVNFGTGTEWSEGNYRGSGVTGFPDFLLLSNNYGERIDRLPITQNVPEPTMMAPVFVLLILLQLRLRQRNTSRYGHCWTASAA